VPYTRVIEHKHFECGRLAQLPVTAVTYEYPDSYEPGKTPYYPINDARNTALYNEYKALAANCPGVTFGGRLGQYAYYDMDDTIAAALAGADELAAI
ncbi:MAG: UDP-galactopyranose mutase, partial [Alloprevotella sp.]